MSRWYSSIARRFASWLAAADSASPLSARVDGWITGVSFRPGRLQTPAATWVLVAEVIDGEVIAPEEIVPELCAIELDEGVAESIPVELPGQHDSNISFKDMKGTGTVGDVPNPRPRPRVLFPIPPFHHKGTGPGTRSKA